jgi:hypothetical protein
MIQTIANTLGNAVHSGDAVSQLVRLAAHNVKLEGFGWSGKGHEDVQRVVTYARNLQLAQKEIWQAVSQLMNHETVKLVCETDEAVAAELYAHILRARACIELNNQAGLLAVPQIL